MLALGALFYSQNKNEEAEGYISKAVTSGAMKRDDYARLASGCWSQIRIKRLLSIMKRQLRWNHAYFDYYNLACAYAKQNDLENALKALSSSVKERLRHKTTN